MTIPTPVSSLKALRLLLDDDLIAKQSTVGSSMRAYMTVGRLIADHEQSKQNWTMPKWEEKLRELDRDTRKVKKYIEQEEANAPS